MENGESDPSQPGVQRPRFTYTPPESPVERRRFTNYVPPSEVNTGQIGGADRDRIADEALRAEFGDRTAEAARIRAQRLVDDLKSTGLPSDQIDFILRSVKTNIGVSGAMNPQEQNPFIGDNNQEKGKGDLIAVKTWTEGVVNIANAMLEGPTK